MRTGLKLEQLKSRLDSNGLKPTYQRLSILRYLSEHIHGHPTAETIHVALSREIPTLSMGTVYNTLNIFMEKGLISGVTITGSQMRYDFVTASHHHLLCKRCGRIIDVDTKCVFAQKQKMVVEGHRIEEVHGYFKGICKDCYRNVRRDEAEKRTS